MKKTLLYLGSALLASTSLSQITVTVTNFANVGDQVINSKDTTSLIGATTAGASQIWDYSALLDDERDTINFVTPSSAPLGSNYPTADIAFNILGSSTAYATKTASLIEVMGLATDVNGLATTILPAIFYDNQTLVDLPANYTDANIDTYQYRVLGTAAQFGQSFPVDSARGTITGTRNSSIDAWGTLTTPLGTFNVLRMADTIVENQLPEGKVFGTWTPGTAVNSTRYYHRFITNDVNSKWILLSYEVNASGLMLAKTAEWARVIPATTSIKDNATNEFVLYPNPTKNTLTINSKNSIENISVMTLDGKIILTANNTKTIDVSTLRSGLYIAILTSGNELVKMKFNKM